MKYQIKEISIKRLLELLKSNKLDLSPYYQRNDIWSRKDQEQLIDSIISGFPLPSFFIYNRKGEMYEMVDGQQRARTILRFINNEITDSKKNNIDNYDKNQFLSYVLNVTEIDDVADDKEIEEFYVLVNKKGKHLTTPELHKAEFAGTRFLTLTEELLNYQNFMNLNLFTESSSKRMNDRNFVEELLAYLLHDIQDKKRIIEKIYKEDITIEEEDQIRTDFKEVINKIALLNDIHPLAKTRYKQRNDFYTLFNFIHQNLNESINLYKSQYNLLIGIDDFISPSSPCFPLKEYALNCVSQSNSKKARESRLDFFNELLLNKTENFSDSEILREIYNYLEDLVNIDINKVDDYYIMNIS